MSQSVSKPLFRIVAASAAPAGPAVACWQVVVQAESDILRAHFPGHPLVPGACLLDLCCQLAERHRGRALTLVAAPTVKFLHPVEPQAAPLTVTLTADETTADGMKASFTIARGECLHARLTLVLREAADVCAIIPVYDNRSTVGDVVRRTRTQLRDVIVVDDGSTDGTADVLSALPDEATLHVVTCPHNGGKGAALREGFRLARRLGFRYAVTLDADGQHYPEDIPALLEAHRRQPDALVVGSRNLQQANMPGRNTAANRFSNFWFALQTWQPLPDTQTGFRLYPLGDAPDGPVVERLLTSRYEAELELLVFAAWAGTPLVPVPVRVYYPPQAERVSHFRPVADFARISLLNTVLCVLMLFYGWPRLLWHRLTRNTKGTGA